MPRMADLILEAGRARAQGELGAGQAWGNGVLNLGQALTQGLQQRQAIQEQQQATKLRDLQMRAGEADLAAGTRAAEGQNILGSALASRLDPSQVESQLAELGRGDLIPAFRKSYQEAETAALNLKTAKAKIGELEADYFGSLAMGVKPFIGDPDGGIGAVTMALQHAKANGYADADQLLEQITRNPQMVPQLVDGLIAKSPTYSKIAGEAEDRRVAGLREDRALRSAQQIEADRNADNARADAAAAALQRDREADNRRADANAARTAQGSPQWVTTPSGEQAYRIPQQGDKHYDPVADRQNNSVPAEAMHITESALALAKRLYDPRTKTTDKDLNIDRATGAYEMAGWTQGAVDFNSVRDQLVAALALPNLGALKGPMSDKDILFVKQLATRLENRKLSRPETERAVTEAVKFLESKMAGARRPIPGFDGAEAEFRNGAWVRVK